MMHLEAELPKTVEEITKEWLGEALAKRVPGIKVSSLIFEKVIWGTATKILLNVDYVEHGPQAARKLWVKGCFDERVRAHAGGGIFVTEACFFGDLAQDLDIPLPEVWYAAKDVEESQGIIVIGDLSGDRVTFGEIGGGLFHPDAVAAGLETQARWQGSTFGDGVGQRYPWLATRGIFRQVIDKQLTKEYWTEQFERVGAVRVPETLQDRVRVEAAFHQLWRMHDTAIPCLIHGDAHIGNTFVDDTGKMGFLDWQTPSLGPWAHDVAYFIASALGIDDRRNNERALLAHYLENLASFGGPTISLDEAWRDYVKHCLYGFCWALTSPNLNALKLSVAMAERYIAAIEDHDSLAAFELDM